MAFSELLQRRHAAELSVIGGLLQEAGIPSDLIEPTEGLPLPVLLIRLPVDESNRERVLHASFVPVDEELESIRLLQLLNQLPFMMHDAKGAGDGGLEKLMARVNALTAIGQFSVSDDGEVHFRYVHALPASRTADSEELLELLAVFTLMLSTFAPGLEEVGTGRLRWQEVWKGWS